PRRLHRSLPGGGDGHRGHVAWSTALHVRGVRGDPSAPGRTGRQLRAGPDQTRGVVRTPRLSYGTRITLPMLRRSVMRAWAAAAAVNGCTESIRGRTLPSCHRARTADSSVRSNATSPHKCPMFTPLIERLASI